MLPVTPHRFFEGGSLPSAFEAGGMSVAFVTDFRAWLKYDYLRDCKDLTTEEFVSICIDVCCKKISLNAEAGFIADALIWFYSCADVERLSQLKITPRAQEDMAARKKTMSTYWDSFHLWGSFKKQYGIDLYTCGEIHWWDFRRMYDGLKHNTPLRGVDALRNITRAKFMNDEKLIQRERGKDFAEVLLDQVFAALPGNKQ